CNVRRCPEAAGTRVSSVNRSLQPALIHHVPAHRRRPVPARIMLPALIPAELANRQARHHVSRHHPIQGRLGELAIGPAIPHADPVGTTLTLRRHNHDAVTGPAPGHATTPVTFSRTCRKRHSGDERHEKATSAMRTYISPVINF